MLNYKYKLYKDAVNSTSMYASAFKIWRVTVVSKLGGKRADWPALPTTSQCLALGRLAFVPLYCSRHSSTNRSIVLLSVNVLWLK